MNTVRRLAERRAWLRFPIQQELSFLTVEKKVFGPGSGQTQIMSSKAVLFSTDRVLATGQRLELRISWPALLNGEVALQLVALGRIIRYVPGQAVLKIERHEFRTRALAVCGRIE